MARTRADVGSDLKDMPPASAPPPAPTVQESLPALPGDKTRTGTSLAHKTVTIMGPPGIGKSTLASQWAGGNVFFFNCAGELNDLEVYQAAIGSWRDFLLYGAAVKADPGRYAAVAVDTATALAQFASEKVRKDLGIAHESDADWGKGWSLVRDEFKLAIGKLALLPDTGVLVVAHSLEVEIKTRTSVYNRAVPNLQRGIRDALVQTSDIVLFIDWGEDDRSRVIKTKPHREWEAKERGEHPRLPAEITWPLGINGYDLLQEHWSKED